MLFKVLLLLAVGQLAVGSTRWNGGKVGRVLHKRNFSERVEVSEFFELRLLKTVNSTAPPEINEEMKEKVGVKKASNDEKEEKIWAISFLGVLVSLTILVFIFKGWDCKMERMTPRARRDSRPSDEAMSAAMAFWCSVRTLETPTPPPTPSPPSTPPPPPTPPRTPPPPYEHYEPPSYEDAISGRVVCPAVLIVPVHRRPS